VRAVEARARERRSSRGGFGSSLSANRLWQSEPEGEATKRRRRLERGELGRSSYAAARRSGQEQRGVRFDVQCKTGGGGRPVLMASQQMERAAELQNPEVRAELNWHVRECERKCFANGRLGSFPQARAYAKQRTTRKQVGGRWCGSRTGAAAMRMVAQVCR
jgi:hypothetical protein